jgi:hypothetical protein
MIIVYENFIDPTYCDEITDTVFALTEHWRTVQHKSEAIEQIKQLGIGSAGIDSSYVKSQRTKNQDGTWQVSNFSSQDEHEKKFREAVEEVRQHNVDVILNNFPGLDYLIEHRLSELIKKPCKFLPNGTLFGFNIQYGFLGYEAGRGWHFDDQVKFYSKILLANKVLGEQYSLTIPVSVPQRTTFQYYEETWSDYTANPWEEHYMPCFQHIGLTGNDCKNPECPFDPTDITTIELSKGQGLLQIGRCLHRAGESYFEDGESRITIQMFGTEVDGIIWLYN